MTRLFVFLAALLLLAAAGAAAATGETADTAAAAVTAETQEKPVDSSIAPAEPSIFSWAYWQEGGEKGTSKSEVFRNFGLFFVAVIALGFGIWRAVTAYMQAQASQRQAQASQRQAHAAYEQAQAAHEQARIAEQGHFTERFSTAVEHLGSKQLPVRLGGIYALWRLAEDSSVRDLKSVIDILCAFVRHPPHEPAEPKDKADEEDDMDTIREIRPDAQTVLKLIGSDDPKYRHHLPDAFHLDLTYAHLVLVNLPDANLTGANLRGADLRHAHLMGTILRGADLTGAELSRAVLRGADLTGAIVAPHTQPKEAAATGALEYFRNTTAIGIFEDADLTGANLTDVKNLTQSQVDLARCDPDDPPVLPSGLTPPKRPPKPKP